MQVPVQAAPIKLYIISVILIYATHASESEEEKCKIDRRKKGEVLKHFYMIPKFNTACEGTPSHVLIMKKLNMVDLLSGLKVLKFPGCYQLDAKLLIQNVKETAKWKDNTEPDIFAHLEWKIDQDEEKDFLSTFKCIDADENGCNGLGNDCYYCEVCKNIVEFQLDGGIRKKEVIKCPTGKGFQTLNRQFCFEDWGSLDEDKDGDPDFICDSNFKQYKELSQRIYKGLGNVQLKITLANNNTASYKKKRNSGTRPRAALKQMLKEEMLVCEILTFDLCENEPREDEYTGDYVCND